MPDCRHARSAAVSTLRLCSACNFVGFGRASTNLQQDGTLEVETGIARGADAPIRWNEGSAAMFTQSRLARILWKWVAPIVGVAAIALAVYFYFNSPRPRSYTLRATAGNTLGTRHKLGIRLRDEVADRRVVLNLEPCAGSEEALDWVDRRKVDVALVQGALSPDGRSNVRQVATLHV